MPGGESESRRAAHRRAHREPRNGPGAAPLTIALVSALLALVLVGGLAVALDGPAEPTASSGGPGTSGTGLSTAAQEDDGPGATDAAETTDAAEPSAQPVLPPAPVAVPGVVLERMSPAQRERQQARIALRKARAVAQRTFTVRIGTFNVLGSNHTAPGGDRRAYPPASVRNGGAVALIRRYGVEVLGTQETKADQVAALTRGTGMQAWPTSGDTDNAVLWDPDRFELVDASSFSITFMNSVRPQTILRLRDRGTGREFYVVNMHASAGGGKYAVSRAAGHNTAVSVVNDLRAEGLPVFLTGDMNDRAEFFCRVAPPTGMVAAIGGSTSGGCSPAPALAVDWVTATPDVDFSDYVEDRSPLGRISDHHFINAEATVGPGEPVEPDAADD